MRRGREAQILAYADEMMCVENHFEKGAIGALHHHPHTQITYVVSGQFEFTINGEKKIVNPGDALLKREFHRARLCLPERGNPLRYFYTDAGRICAGSGLTIRAQMLKYG